MDGRFRRPTVERIVTLFKQGRTEREILAEYPDLEAEDLRATLRYYKSTRQRLLWASAAKVLGVALATAAVVAVGFVIESTPLIVFGGALAVVAIAGCLLGVLAEVREQKRLMQQEPVRPSRVSHRRSQRSAPTADRTRR